LTPQQKQSELHRYRAILLAALDYLEERFGGSIVFDEFDPATAYYQQQKIQTEKYFIQRRLDRLQQRLASLTKRMQNREAFTFTAYLKEKTGYDIDLVEDVRKRVDAIVAQNEIRNQKELNDVFTMLQYYQTAAADEKVVENLESLLSDYSKRTIKTPKKRKGEYDEVISSVVKDGIEEVTVRSWTVPKPKHFAEQEAMSPDGKRRLRVVQWGDGKNASTYVEIMFPAGSGVVFGMIGIHDVKAFWKDNATIVIETPKNPTANTQHKQVRSFDDVVTIEYMEG
jgi:hypothetical protein